MFTVRFEYPLPNNGDRYDLSQDELRELLDKAYNNGFLAGKFEPAGTINTSFYGYCPKCNSINVYRHYAEIENSIYYHCSDCGNHWK